MNKIETFFAGHPKRRFWLGYMPLDALHDVASSGWLWGAAGSAGHGLQTLTIADGQTSVLVAVRCPITGAAKSRHDVLLLDKNPPADFTSDTTDEDQETAARWMWECAEIARTHGVPPFAVMACAIRQA